jgi:glycosyltransferase involved in cell wall biosynthesis
MKVTLIIPTLDEREGMVEIMPRVKKEWYDQLIILDGGSTDGTIELAREMGYFVYGQKKPGIRNAYKEILDIIKGDVVVTFSPDGNCIPELIPALLDKMQHGYDMVIVSRYLNGAKSYDDDVVTAFGNWLFTKTINVLHGGNYTDAMGIFRAYRKSQIYALELEKEEGYATAEWLFRTRISWEPLLSVRCAKMQLKVSEIPGDEPLRIGGERKLKILKWGAAYYFQIVREKFFWR